MRILKWTFMLFALTCMVCSCSDFKDSTDYNIEEQDKQLSGSWRISKATRNGLDITRLMDFSQFEITFNEDQTYTIENYLPFLVRENGTWEIDNPKFPSQIAFTENGAAGKVSTFEYVIVGGERQMILTFVPGYKTNSYVYTFERSSNE
jgi:hypothetical protein